MLEPPNSQKDGIDRWGVTSRKRRAVQRLNLERGFRAGGVAVFDGARRRGGRVLVGMPKTGVGWLAPTHSRGVAG